MCIRDSERGVYIAHCPASNMNVSSGIAPVRRFLDMGLHTGLGSDVAGGTVTSIFRAMADAIQAVSYTHLDVYKRQEQEIRAFVPEEYWLLDAVLRSGDGEFTARYFGNAEGKAELHSEEETDAVIAAVTGKEFKICLLYTS